MPLLLEYTVAGIEGIKDFFYSKFMKDGKTHWFIETQGSNFLKLMAHPKIITSDLISNNMWDIYTNLGIEAAREFLIQEFKNVVSSDGTYINERHVMLLVDIMTATGTISSISRYGIKREKSGPLAKASFEESLENFLKAGVFGDTEPAKGVSASIMCGKRSSIGTGLCSLIFDKSQYGTGVKENSLFVNNFKPKVDNSTKTLQNETTDSDSDIATASDIVTEEETEEEETDEEKTEEETEDEDTNEEETDDLFTEGDEDEEVLIFDDEVMDDFMAELI